MAARDSIRRARPLLGTFVEIGVTGSIAGGAEAAIDAAFDAIAKVHRLMSFHDPESDVSRINRAAPFSAVAVDPWTFQVLAAANELRDQSAGAFDVGVAPVLQRYGLLPALDRENLTAGEIVSESPVSLLSEPRIKIGAVRAGIDLGGIAKGFAVDRAVEVLRQYGQSSGVVNAGGDLFAFGPMAHPVHIRDPRDHRRTLCCVEIVNAALASSGHLVDPILGKGSVNSAIIDPARNALVAGVAGATVRAPSCLIADALTKIVMIRGEAALPLLRRHQASALFVTSSGEISTSPGWPDAIAAAA
jgi:thiamine biosynthesis lipoprotein